MYENFFGFSVKPFALEPDARFIVLAEDQEESLATLIYAVEEREGWVLLLGQPGVGKTTLIMALLRELGDRVISAVLTNPRLDPLDFYNTLALELGMEGPYASKGVFLTALGDVITDCRQEGKILLLVVDEAQSLQEDLLEELRLLGNLDTGRPKTLCICLVAQLEFLRSLKHSRARALMQRLRRHHVLQPLNQEETVNYIRHRLEVAGGSPEIFQPAALKVIYEATRGIPRLVNILCDDALLLAFTAEQDQVDRELVLAAVKKNLLVLLPLGPGGPPGQREAILPAAGGGRAVAKPPALAPPLAGEGTAEPPAQAEPPAGEGPGEPGGAGQPPGAAAPDQPLPAAGEVAPGEAAGTPEAEKEPAADFGRDFEAALDEFLDTAPPEAAAPVSREPEQGAAPAGGARPEMSFAEALEELAAPTITEIPEATLALREEQAGRRPRHYARTVETRREATGKAWKRLLILALCLVFLGGSYFAWKVVWPKVAHRLGLVSHELFLPGQDAATTDAENDKPIPKPLDWGPLVPAEPNGDKKQGD
ncbi:MAG: AAA family ATPase [Deltaproteobacteria bacterium]|nr:AAA family ATPase [Deltaproteobacteria bacterium]